MNVPRMAVIFCVLSCARTKIIEINYRIQYNLIHYETV